MSSNPLDRLGRSFTFRLSLGYAMLFTFSAVVLFGLLYLLLAATLQSKDREIIEARLRECAAVYDNGGLAALQELVQRSRDSGEVKSFFIRLAGQQGSVLLLTAPEDWVQFDTSALDRGGDPARLGWLRIPKDEQRDFTVAAMRVRPWSSSEASTRCFIRSNGRIGAMYSSLKASHISLGVTSPPAPAVPSAIS